MVSLSRVSLTERKNSKTAVINYKGTLSEVPTSQILPWYEGLLVLEEIVKTQDKDNLPAWVDGEILTALETEKARLKNLSPVLYTERRLVKSAVTGAQVEDSDGKTWDYRRDGLNDVDDFTLQEGDPKDNMNFPFKRLADYMPPWQAFCHPKCGFYQDFYLVEWQAPHEKIDYSKTENGGPLPGTTWEPDQNMSACCDILRVKAKKAWIEKKKAEEKREDDERKQQEKAAAEKKRKLSSGWDNALDRDIKKQKMAQFRRDGTPLEPDIFLFPLGHDFVPDANKSEKFTNVRFGWPMKPEDYPPGHAVATPPGFCFEGCDCMDDQRPQRGWETHKHWLEEAPRTANCKKALDSLLAQTEICRRRGTVSGRSYLETVSTATLPNDKFIRGAAQFLQEVRLAVVTVCKQIPYSQLSVSARNVIIPCAALVKEDLEYLPLKLKAWPYGKKGEALPSWLQVHPGTGEITSTRDKPITEDFVLHLEFEFPEGKIMDEKCTLLHKDPPGVGRDSPWMKAIGPVIGKFNSGEVFRMEPSLRSICGEHLSELYDANEKSLRKDVNLADWTHVLLKVMRMLRASTMGKCCFETAASAQPRTPQW